MVVFHLENYGQSVVACEEGPEGVKWEMGFAYFWTGIYQQKKQLKMGMGLRFEQESH